MSQATLIRSRRFAPLFMTQFLGALNDNVFRFALIIFVTFTVAERMGMDSRTLVVITGAIFILPFFLFSALAGQIADKFEKSHLIRFFKSTEIVVMGLGAAGFLLGNYYFLLGVLFLMGTQSTFFGPLKYGVLPQHLSRSELTGGNALIQMGTYIAILGGSVLGGLLASLGTVASEAIVMSIVGLAICGRIAAHFIPTASASDAALTIDFNPFSSTWSLLIESMREHGLFIIMLLISTFWFVGATFLSVVPTFGKELLNANEQAVTLLSAAFTVGIGIGSLSCERLSRGRIELGLVPLAALGISLAAFDVWLAGVPQAPPTQLTLATFFSYPPALRLFTDLAFIGAAGALYIVPLYAALQARVEAQYCSRVLAALNVMNALFMVTSAGFTLVLFRFGVDVSGVFGIVAALNVVAMLAGMQALPEFTSRVCNVLRQR
jgi:MFS family permease